MPALQLPTGTILVEDAGLSDAASGVVLYARVSSVDQHDDLERQLGRLMEYATREGLAVTRAVKEVGSAVNAKRPALLRLLRDPSVGVIVVEHRDRLTRFGFEPLEAALAAQGRRILVMDESEVADDPVRDMTEVLTSFCARLYGRRSARRWAQRVAACVQANGPDAGGAKR